MQSTPEAATQTYFVGVAAWALEMGPEAVAEFSPLLNRYWSTIGAKAGTRTAARRPGPPVAQPQSASPAAQPQPAPAQQRIRATPGTPGQKDGQVLAKIVATPGITIEPLRRYFDVASRKLGPNILGTSLSRLMKAGRIAGTPKSGPFTATEAGVEAARKVTSINTRRRASSKATTGATTAEATQPQAAAG
jgi:hypothetical protein